MTSAAPLFVGGFEPLQTLVRPNGSRNPEEDEYRLTAPEHPEVSEGVLDAAHGS